MTARGKALLIATVLLTVGATAAWLQEAAMSGGAHSVGIVGKVTQDNSPAANLQVVFTNPETNKQYKTKTDRKGEYVCMGMMPSAYKVEVIDPKAGVLYTKQSQMVDGNSSLAIDLSKPVASGGVPGAGAEAARSAKEQAAAIDAEKTLVASLNALVVQAQAAMQAQKWADAEVALKKIIEANPETTRWEFFKALGDSQAHSQEYSDAVQAYERGVQVAQGIVSGSAPADPRNPNPDPGRAAAGIGQMLSAQGSAYIQMGKTDEAIASFKRATDKSPNPGMAYYNLCAAEFNYNKMEEAAAACDKSVAADPTRADAWFYKGSALYKSAKTENGKRSALPGTSEALNKYLQLDPNGAHASEAKTMLLSLAQN